MISLKGKNVFLTGATGGLGKEIAKILTEEKCNLFLTATNQKRLDKFAKELGKNVKAKRGDLREIEDICGLITCAKKTFGNIDILINCAAVFKAKFNAIFTINVEAPYLFIRGFSKDMKKNKWGRIVNIGSTSAYMGVVGSALYCATKHALLGLSRSFYKELNPYDIRVFCLSPGSIQTNMGKSIKGDWNTFLEPKEVAEYIVNTMKYDKQLITEEVTINRFNK